MSSRTAALEALLAEGRDDKLLRFGLGSTYLAEDDPASAEPHLAAAVGHDAAYSAAWNLLGKARTLLGDRDGARNAYEAGIAAAEAHGDVQAAKMMRVFLKRLG